MRVLWTTYALERAIDRCGRQPGRVRGPTLSGVWIMTPATAIRRCLVGVGVLAVGMLAATSETGRAPAQSTSPRWAYPDDTRTGVAAVDAAIGAMVRQDAAALRSQFTGAPMPCTGNQGIGAIPCPAGQPAGTGVLVFRSGDCETTFVPATDPTLDEVATKLASPRKHLFAVARTGGSPTGSEFAAFFGGATDSGESTVQGIDDAGITLDINSGGIIGVNAGCRDGVAHRLALRSYSSFLLAPKLNPGPPNTGNAGGFTAQGDSLRPNLAIAIVLPTLVALVGIALVKAKAHSD